MIVSDLLRGPPRTAPASPPVAGVASPLDLLRAIKWRSIDRDNMEFSATITCWRMDAIREALASPVGGDGSSADADTHRAPVPPVVVRQDRADELPVFLDALGEWGCDDTVEQAGEILRFLANTVGVSKWREKCQ